MEQAQIHKEHYIIDRSIKLKERELEEKVLKKFNNMYIYILYKTFFNS